MGGGLPEIYAELRAELEGPPPQGQDWLYGAREFVSSLNFQDADIVSIQDFAVAFIETPDCMWDFPGNEGQAIADHLRCLLEPVQEELLPPNGPRDWRIWENFAAAQMQQRQFCILAVYQSFYYYPRSLPENSPAVQAVQKFKNLVASFQQVHLHLARQIRISSELQAKLTNFTTRLSQFLDHDLCKCTTRAMTFLAMIKDVQWLEVRCQWLSAEASEIAAEVAKLPCIANSSEADSHGSWSVISPNPSGHGVPTMRPDTVGELGSVASGYSLVSERSYLSGHGGPHCFLPSHLFKLVHPGEELTSLVPAKDLRTGIKILAADGVQIEVVKVEEQKTNTLLELEIDDALSFTTTPNHRIMVPSDGDDATVKAKDLKLGTWVMCSDLVAKRVIGMRWIPVEQQEVLAISFHPDKAVACEEPVVLSKGHPAKAMRRGGMCRRGVRQEVMSIPDTAPGEYRD